MTAPYWTTAGPYRQTAVCRACGHSANPPAYASRWPCAGCGRVSDLTARPRGLISFAEAAVERQRGLRPYPPLHGDG